MSQKGTYRIRLTKGRRTLWRNTQGGVTQSRESAKYYQVRGCARAAARSCAINYSGWVVEVLGSNGRVLWRVIQPKKGPTRFIQPRTEGLAEAG